VQSDRYLLSTHRGNNGLGGGCGSPSLGCHDSNRTTHGRRGCLRYRIDLGWRYILGRGLIL
jgi:hypothetical protein